MRRLVFMGIVVGFTLLWASRVRAAAYDFSAGSWIIPMDTCYQPSQTFNGSSFSSTPTASTMYGSNSNCPDGALSSKDGLLKAYGLRLSPVAARRHRSTTSSTAPSRRSTGPT